MKYIVSCPRPHTHFVEIEMVVEQNSLDKVLFQLPSWRPGRYELGNFARNIQKWGAFDDKGRKLDFKKITKDCWEVLTKGCKTIHIRYNYYAAQLDGGACWLDEDQLYINGIHCFLYVPERRHETCEVELKIPSNYKVATGMTKESDHLLKAKDYDELVDCPFVASASLQHNAFVLDNVIFHTWFQGECKPDWSKIISDFFLFVNEQYFETMHEFPSKEYHFIFQVLPYRFHHGVEHCNSTVIAMGPGSDLMKGELYNEFLGVSSHELFHTWNIKQIRPVEMMPYDYTKENYSRLGYVCEGVTTYYGDLFLFKSRVFSDDEYFKALAFYLQRHYDNFGRNNLSVADSSFDTWLDGYGEGIPWRKTNIYTEGCLCAFMTDLLIRKQTQNKKSLDDVMRTLYADFAKKGIGYSETDYRQVVENTAGASFGDFFRDYVNGTHPYEEKLKEVLAYAGCELHSSHSKKYYEDHFGFKTIQQNGKTIVSSVAPGSPADESGMWKEDEIILVNETRVENNLHELCTLFPGQTISLTLASSLKKTKSVSLTPVKDKFFKIYTVAKTEHPAEEQQEFYKAWSRRVFFEEKEEKKIILKCADLKI